MSKIAFQFQTIPKWAKDVVWAANAPWVLLIEPPEKDPFDGTVRVVGRNCLPGGDAEECTYWLRGRQGAEDYMNRLEDSYAARSYVDVWQGPNEPFNGDATCRMSLSDFTPRWADRMHAKGRKVATGAFSVGWPAYDNAALAQLLPTVMAGDYLMVHEYSAPTMQDRAGDHCLRYRKLYASLGDMTARPLPPLLIGECGIDGGVAPVYKARTGWRTFTKSWESYLAQLAWYDGEIQKDSYVLAAFVFVAGARSDWRDFELQEAQCRSLAKYISGSAHEPLPTDETATDAKTLAVKCRWWLEEYARQREAGNTACADAIMYALIQLFYRLERALQSQG